MTGIPKKPKYLLCKEQITHLIIDSGLRPGELLPSITQLIELLQTGRTNIQNALSGLCEDGILEKKAGSGCYLKAVPQITVENVHTTDTLNFVDYWDGPFAMSGKRSLRVGILIEMNHFGGMWRELASVFRHKSGIDVELVALNSADEGENSGTDIFQIPNYLLAEFADRGALLDAKNVGFDFMPEKYISCAGGLVGHGGRIWGVPMVCSCGCIFFDRREGELGDMIYGAGDIEILLASFEDYAKTLKSGYHAVTQNCHLLHDYLKYVGIAVYHTTAERIDAFKLPESKAFLSRCEPFFRNPRIFAGLDTKPFSRVVSDFTSGRLPSIIGNISLMLQLFRDLPFIPGIAAMPLSAGGCGELVSFINVISAASKKNDECRMFLEFLQEDTTQEMFAKQGRPVAHRAALAQLHVAGLDRCSCSELVKAIEVSSFSALEKRRYGEFISSDLVAATDAWQRGRIDLDSMIERISKRFEQIK